MRNSKMEGSQREMEKKCQICGKGEVVSEQHFLIHWEAYSHINDQGGIKLENNSWQAIFQDSHVDDMEREWQEWYMSETSCWKPNQPAWVTHPWGQIQMSSAKLLCSQNIGYCLLHAFPLFSFFHLKKCCIGCKLFSHIRQLSW